MQRDTTCCQIQHFVTCSVAKVVVGIELTRNSVCSIYFIRYIVSCTQIFHGVDVAGKEERKLEVDNSIFQDSITTKLESIAYNKSMANCVLSAVI
jgi:hypothetical protein